MDEEREGEEECVWNGCSVCMCWVVCLRDECVYVSVFVG